MSDMASSSVSSQQQNTPNPWKMRRTAYSLFCSEQSQEEEFQNIDSNKERFRLFGERWRQLPPESKEMYHKRSRSEDTPVSLNWRKKEWDRTVRKIRSLIEYLPTVLPTEGFIVLAPDNGDVVLFGTNKGQDFLNAYPGLTREMFRAFLNSPEAPPTKQKVKVTAKDIQDIFNDKYAQASGIPGRRMPYSSIEGLGITMEGLPSNLQLRHPTKYGGRQLCEIYKVRDNLKCIIPESTKEDQVTVVAAEPETSS